MTQPAASTVSEQTALPSTYPKTSPKPRAPAAGAVTRSEEGLLSAAGAWACREAPDSPAEGQKLLPHLNTRPLPNAS